MQSPYQRFFDQEVLTFDSGRRPTSGANRGAQQARTGARRWSHGADGCPGKPTRDRSPSVSVIVPTVGRPRLLQAALESLAACAPRAVETIVVDQSQRDDGRAIVDRFRGRRPHGQPVGSQQAARLNLACSRRETRSFS